MLTICEKTGNLLIFNICQYRIYPVSVSTRAYRVLKTNMEDNNMKINPLFDKVVLKQVEAVETTKAGILLPGSAQEKPQVSEVVAVGPGGLVDGNEVKMTLKVGDKVIIGKYTGTEIKLDGVEYTIVSQSDILATIE